jgi:hypothetical protein
MFELVLFKNFVVDKENLIHLGNPKRIQHPLCAVLARAFQHQSFLEALLRHLVFAESLLALVAKNSALLVFHFLSSFAIFGKKLFRTVLSPAFGLSSKRPATGKTTS